MKLRQSVPRLATLAILALALWLISGQSQAFEAQQRAVAAALAELDRVASFIASTDAQIAEMATERGPEATRRILDADFRQLSRPELSWRIRYTRLQQHRANLDTRLANARHRYTQAAAAFKAAIQPIKDLHAEARQAMRLIGISPGHEANKRRAIETIERDLRTLFAIEANDRPDPIPDLADVLDAVGRLIEQGRPHKEIERYLLEWSGARPALQRLAGFLSGMAISTKLAAAQGDPLAAWNSRSERLGAWNRSVRQLAAVANLARDFARAGEGEAGFADLNRLEALINGIGGLLSSGEYIGATVKLFMIYHGSVMSSIRGNLEHFCRSKAVLNLQGLTHGAARAVEIKSQGGWSGLVPSCPFGRIDFVDWRLALIEDPHAPHHPKRVVNTIIRFDISVPESFTDSAWILVAPADVPLPESVTEIGHLARHGNDDWVSSTFSMRWAHFTNLAAMRKTFDFAFRTRRSGHYVARLFRDARSTKQMVAPVFFEVVKTRISRNLRPTFAPRATTELGQSCENPVDFFSDKKFEIENTLDCRANLFADTDIGVDDLLEIDKSIWLNEPCGSAWTQIAAGTVLLRDIAPGATVAIRVLDAVSIECETCTSASGTLRLACADD